MDDATLEIIRLLSGVLERQGVPYLVGGSVASSVHGFNRPTEDVDFAAKIRGQHVSQFVSELEAEFYVDAEMIKDAIKEKSSFNVIHYGNGNKADVFVVGFDEWTEQQIARKKLTQVGDDTLPLQVFVATAEDTVVQKLKWYRLGHEISEKQWRDVTGVLKVQADRLDVPYMRHWAGRLEVADLLERALDDSGLLPST